MDATQVKQLVDYYVNLLIIQYNGKPKAAATIRAITEQIVASGIYTDVLNAYNIDTAVGAQLDVIGKYVGVDRFFSVTDPVDYFAFTDYVEADPDSEDKYGLVTYANFETEVGNGVLNYNSVLTIDNKLVDDDYRVIIKLKIIQNNSNHSHRSIDDSIFEFFGDAVRPDSIGNMQMTYFITSQLTPVIQAALIKNILPRPMGVGLNLIKNVTGTLFGMTTYSQVEGGYNNPNTSGFSDYTDYDTKEGSFLVYNQLEYL